MRTDFDGSDAKAASFKHDAYAAGGDAFAEAANNSSGDQNVLHFVIWGNGECGELCRPNVCVYIRAGSLIFWCTIA